MNSNEEVKKLFDRQHAITNECIRRYDDKQSMDDLRIEEVKIQSRLTAILVEGLMGEFEIKDMKIEKRSALVTITNGIFVIPCSVDYQKIGLSNFVRKPSAKQEKQRILELKTVLIPQQLLNQNRYVVGTSYFEAQEGDYIVMSRQISIVA